MAVDKNFVVKHGLEVSNTLFYADANTKRVGVATTVPGHTLDVAGGIGVTNLYVSGIGTVVDLQIGTNGNVFRAIGAAGSVGIGTAFPSYLLDVRTSSPSGTTALYVKGDVQVTGDLNIDDISVNQATFDHVYVGTAATAVNLYVPTSGIATIGVGIVTTLSGTHVSYSGVGTITTFNSTRSTITNLVGTSNTLSNLVSTSSTITNLAGTSSTITNLVGTSNTLTNLVSTSSSITQLRITGVATIAVLDAASVIVTGIAATNLTVANNFGVSGITTLAQLAVSGVTTSRNLQVVGFTTLANASVTGISTIGTLAVTGLTTTRDLQVIGVTTSNSYYIGANEVIDSTRQLKNIATLDDTTKNTITSSLTGTAITFSNIRVTGVSSFVGLSTFGNGLIVVSGMSTLGRTDITNLSVGVGTVTTLNSTSGTVTTLNSTSGTITNLSGTIGTVTTLNSTSGTITNLSGTIGTVTTLNSTTGTVTDLNVTRLRITGISTLIGTTLVGGGTTTGTASQTLQITGGTYISGNAGIGNTNPQYKLDVTGDVNFTGTIFNNGVPFTGITSVGYARTAFGLEGSPSIQVGVVTASQLRATGILTAPSITVTTISPTTSTVTVATGVTVSVAGIDAGVGIITASEFKGRNGFAVAMSLLFG